MTQSVAASFSGPALSSVQSHAYCCTDPRSVTGHFASVRLAFHLRGAICPVQPAFDLFGRADDQLIAGLGLRSVYGMGWQFQHTCCLNAKGCDAEPRKVFDNMNHFVVFIEIDEIQRKQHAQGMNSLRRHYPEPFIELEPQFSNQASEPCEGVVRRNNTQTEKALASLVVYAVCMSLHWYVQLRARHANPPLSGVDNFSGAKIPRTSFLVLPG